MVKPKDAKVWNEELAQALRAREDMCRQQGSARQHLWRDGAKAISAVRNDIYTFRNGRIVNLPSNMKKTVEELCRQIIAGNEPTFPEGYVPMEAVMAEGQNPYANDPYMKRIKIRGGAYAILMAFHLSQTQVLTKAQICDAAQPFCDEQMEANFHAGRARGAWSSIKTLEKHGLINTNSTVRYNEAAGGLRSLGKWTYVLTRNGEMFIEALFAAKPEARRQVEMRQGGIGEVLGGGGFLGGVGLPPAGGMPGNVLVPHVRARTPERINATTRSASSKPSQDREDLRSWASTANIGESRTFNVSKARRIELHNLCDELSAAMQEGGRRLRHESEGVGRGRTLRVTVEPFGWLGSSLMASPAGSVMSMPRVASLSMASAVKSSPPRKLSPMDVGRVLDANAESAKKARIPASVAAANAALERQAMRESIALSSKKVVASKALCGSLSRHTSDMVVDCVDEVTAACKPGNDLAATPPQRSRQAETIDLLDSDDDDTSLSGPSESVQDRRKKLFGNSDTQASIVDLAQSEGESEDDTVLPQQVKLGQSTSVMRQLGASDKTIQGRTPTTTIVEDRRDESTTVSEIANPPDFLEDDTDDELPPAAFAKDAPTRQKGNSSCGQAVEIAIFIDNRERNRNATPRYLRMELCRILSSGPLAQVWPTWLPKARVEEKKLDIGDFCFQAVQSSQRVSKRVSIERKRVGDLVQRSFHKDHWYQLQKLRDWAGGNGIGFFLIEGDFRTAVQFNPYGAQDEEAFSPLDHAIEDEESLILFIGRALLLSPTIRFLQTKDEQGSLRAVGSTALMLAAGDQPAEGTDYTDRTTAANNRACLKDRLVAGGIPWKLAGRVSDEVGSVRALAELYESVTSEVCRDNLLVPFISDMCQPPQYTGGPTSWSKAIHRVFFSSEPGGKRMIYEKHCHLVSDDGALLASLHAGVALEEALDNIWEEGQSSKQRLDRFVAVEVPPDLAECFAPQDDDVESSVFKVNVSQRKSKIPSVMMYAVAGGYKGTRLRVFLMNGEDLLERIENVPLHESRFAAIAQNVARVLHRDCLGLQRTSNIKTILVVRGMSPALDLAAKRRNYRSETRTIVDMVLVQLQLVHGIVVLQAVRRKNDREILLRQLAMACFHFQLLVEPVDRNQIT